MKELGGLALLMLVMGYAMSAHAQNIILIIGDDIGVDTIAAYAEGGNAGTTTKIDGMATAGVLFRNAWAEPVCSPTRASMLTGLNPNQHQIGAAIGPNSAQAATGLDIDTTSLADVLNAAGYRTEAFGKWHMGTGGAAGATTQEQADHPNDMGFDHFAGSIYNVGSYTSWSKTTNGTTVAGVTDYIDTDIADDVIASLNDGDPFFIWVGFQNAHTPYHDPPDTVVGGAGEPDFHRAMTEQMDIEIGRIIDHGDFDATDTTVIFIGDNGTQELSTEAPFDSDHAKGTMYEGGVNVPLIVYGEAVPVGKQGDESVALIQATDIFATIVALASASLPSSVTDAVSFVPNITDPAAHSSREWVFAETFNTNGVTPDVRGGDGINYARAARGPRYKLYRLRDVNEYFFDLIDDPYEASALDVTTLTLMERQAYSRLNRVLDTFGVEGGTLGLPCLPWAFTP